MWTAPNLITMSRIAASPLLSWAIWAGHYDYAVCGLAVAAATDWLDGYIAKSFNQTVRVFWGGCLGQVIPGSPFSHGYLWRVCVV